MKLKTGWLSPSGELFECGSLEHYSEARDIVNKFKYENPKHKNYDDLLLKKNWVHIGIATLGTKEWAIYWNSFLTESQKNFLKPYFDNFDDTELKMCITAKNRWIEENDLYD